MHPSRIKEIEALVKNKYTEPWELCLVINELLDEVENRKCECGADLPSTCDECIDQSLSAATKDLLKPIKPVSL